MDNTSPLPVKAILMFLKIVSLSKEAFQGRLSQQKAYFPELHSKKSSFQTYNAIVPNNDARLITVLIF